MPVNFKEATPEQQNAAFDKVYPELLELIKQYIPALFQWQVITRLQSPDGRKLLIRLIHDAIEAAENVDANRS